MMNMPMIQRIIPQVEKVPTLTYFLPEIKCHKPVRKMEKKLTLRQTKFLIIAVQGVVKDKKIIPGCRDR